MIAVLGWGSLIWDPRELQLEGNWREDGPMIRVEFLRRSSRNRVTLVLHSNASEAESLWTAYEGSDWARIKGMLIVREGVEKQPEAIAHWTLGMASPPNITGLAEWAAAKNVEHVLWTNLPPRWDKIEGRAPSADQVVAFLQGLAPDKRLAAEEYVRRAPAQIATPIRTRIQQQFGWTPL